MLPGGKTGRNRVLNDPGPYDADNGKPDLRAGSPPLHYLGSGVEKKKSAWQLKCPLLRSDPLTFILHHPPSSSPHYSTFCTSWLYVAIQQYISSSSFSFFFFFLYTLYSLYLSSLLPTQTHKHLQPHKPYCRSFEKHVSFLLSSVQASGKAGCMCRDSEKAR